MVDMVLKFLCTAAFASVCYFVYKTYNYNKKKKAIVRATGEIITVLDIDHSLDRPITTVDGRRWTYLDVELVED